MAVFASDKFRPYLILSRVVEFTYHSAMWYLMNKANAKPRLIRWVALLQEFDVEIKEKRAVKNLAVDHLSRLESIAQGESTNQEINDFFLEEHLYDIQDVAFLHIQWFSNFANYLLGKVLPQDLTFQQKKKFFSDLKDYFWDDPYLFRIFVDHIVHRCISQEQGWGVLEHCHSSPTEVIID